MDCSTSGLPVYHQLLEFTQTHVRWVDDAIQPSHPLSSPFSPSPSSLFPYTTLFRSLDGDELGWTPGVGDRQGGLVCCSSWGCKELDTTERLNWTEQSPSGVILEPPKIKSDTVSTVSPSISHEVMGPDAMVLVFSMLSFKPTFSLSSFTFIKRLFIVFAFCHKGGVICIFEVIDISPSNLNSSLYYIQPSIMHDVLCI